MSLTFQIILGGLLLGICSIIHVLLLVLTVRILSYLGKPNGELPVKAHWGGLLMVSFAMVVLAHVILIVIWAVVFVLLGVLPDVDEAIYFALVTYTTLGYGDVTVADGFRTFAAMAAITGLLNFGLSTAFLVALLKRLIPEE